jgi:Transposase DDE domain
MTIAIYFHQSSYRTFKDYYTKYVCQYLTSHFPNLVSYNRMVELMPNVLTACLYYLNSCQGKSTGISFAGSTAIPVCHPKRIKRKVRSWGFPKWSTFSRQRNKVFKETAKLSNSSMGWYYGFKLHLIINDSGELLSFLITPGNVDEACAPSSAVENICLL